jgi:hypothetical protein
MKMQNENAVTGQEAVTPEAILREGCLILLQWIESWSEPPQTDAQESVVCHTPAACLDATSAFPLARAISPSGPDSSSLEHQKVAG